MTMEIRCPNEGKACKAVEMADRYTLEWRRKFRFSGVRFRTAKWRKRIERPCTTNLWSTSGCVFQGLLVYAHARMKPRELELKTAVFWILAVATAVSSARYFLFSVATLAHIEDAAAQITAKWVGTTPIPALHPFSHQPVLLLLHVSGGIVALMFGLFQFLP